MLDDEQWEAAGRRLPARRTEDRAGGRRADGAGVRVRQVRRLDRAAADRASTTSRSSSTTCTSPRRGSRVPVPEAPDAHLGPRGQPDLGRRQAARHRRRRPRAPSTCPFPDGDALPGDWWSARTPDGTVVGYGRLDIGWGGDAEILLAVDPARAGGGRRHLRARPARGRGRRPRDQLRLQHGPRQHPSATTCTTGSRCAASAAPTSGDDLRKRVGAGGRRDEPSTGPAGTSGPLAPASGGTRTTRRARARWPRSRGVRRLRRRRRPPVLTGGP